jgi:hypothetical protein
VTSFLRAAKRTVRRLLGTHELERLLAEADRRRRRDLLRLGNAIRYSTASAEELRGSAEYVRVAEIARLLATCRVEGESLVRVGGEIDGGYVMLDLLRPPTVTAGYSFGVGHDVSWDAAMAARGIDLVLYDHTVKQLPAPVPRARFVRTGIRGLEPVPGQRTVAEVIADNGHRGRRDLVLKMDIEGAEWSVLEEVESGTLESFAQIVVEFHGMGRVAHPEGHARIAAALGKLAVTHQPIHVHGNSFEPPLWIGDLVLPEVLEVSYVRRSDHVGKFVPRDEVFPTSLDRPNLPDLPDLFLGRTFTPRR